MLVADLREIVTILKQPVLISPIRISRWPLAPKQFCRNLSSVIAGRQYTSPPTKPRQLYFGSHSEDAYQTLAKPLTLTLTAAIPKAKQRI